MPVDGLTRTTEQFRPESSPPKQILISKDITKNSQEYKTIMGNLDITGDPIPGFDFDSDYLDFENIGPSHLISKNGQPVCALSNTFELPGKQSAAIGYVYEKESNKWEAMAFYKDTKNQWRQLSEYTVDSKTGKIRNANSNNKDNDTLLPPILQNELSNIESNGSSNILYAEKILLSLAQRTTAQEIPTNDTPKKDTWQQLKPEDPKYKMLKKYVNKLVEKSFPNNKSSNNESIAQYLEPTHYSTAGDKDIFLSNTIKLSNQYDAALTYIYDNKKNTLEIKTIVKDINTKEWRVLKSSQKVPDVIASRLSQLVERKQNTYYSLAKNVPDKQPIKTAPVKEQAVDHEKPKASYALATSKGRNHKENQDRGAVADRYIIVCDGAGGIGDGGGRAAEVAKNTIESNLIRIPAVAHPNLVKKSLERTMIAADNTVRKDSGEGASTAIFGVDYLAEYSNEHRMAIASIGDSCFYLVRDNKILKINKEHSVMTEQLQAMYDKKIKDGTMSDADIKQFKKDRRTATKLLGSDANGVLFYDFKVKKGDIVIGVSDGVSDQFTDPKELLDLFKGKKDPKEISQIILRASEQKSVREGRYSSAVVSKEEDRRIGIIRKEDDRIVVVKAYS